jgi:hypothetical protein
MPTHLRVIWIAPEVPGLQALGWLKELGNMTDIPGVEMITKTGNVTRSMIAKVLSEKADVVIFSGHGGGGNDNESDTDYGLKLSDGSTLKPLWFATHVAHCKPIVCIIAACSSQNRDSKKLASMASQMCQASINAVGFPADTEDSAAAVFTEQLVGALAAEATIGAAFNVALESIENAQTAQGVYLTPGLNDKSVSTLRSMQATESELRDIKNELREIRAALATRTGTVALTQAQPSSIGVDNVQRDSSNIRPITRGNSNIKGIGKM